MLFPTNKRKEFKKLIDQLVSDKTKFTEFEDVCRTLVKRFELVGPWLKWHLNPLRASSFFPACQAFDQMEMQRFAELHTNNKRTGKCWTPIPTCLQLEENEHFRDLCQIISILLCKR